MILGVLGIGYSFFTAPKTVEDVEKILAAESHHGGGHAEAAHHDEAAAHEAHVNVAGESHAEAAVANHENHAEAAHGAEVHDAHAEHEHHLKHVLSQLQNKPWAAVYVAALFFMLISLGALAFLCYPKCCAGRMVSCIVQGYGRYFKLPYTRCCNCIFIISCRCISMASLIYMDESGCCCRRSSYTSEVRLP